MAQRRPGELKRAFSISFLPSLIDRVDDAAGFLGRSRFIAGAIEDALARREMPDPPTRATDAA